MMGKREQFIELAQSQVGYAESGDNRTKYAEYFDKTVWQWFNTKKQSSPWCSVWICWLFCQILGADRARTFLGCPSPKNNCAAGVPYLYKYMKALGWEVDKTKGQPGDVIFLSNNKHVGMIEALANGRYQTIEGNKSNKVARGSYATTSSTVAHVCRPNWASVDDVQPEPTPSPAPIPTPEPTSTKYKVKTNTGVPLRLRAAPNTKSAVLTTIPNGTVINVTKTQNGWAYTCYNGYNGWCSMTYLKKV